MHRLKHVVGSVAIDQAGMGDMLVERNLRTTPQALLERTFTEDEVKLVGQCHQ